MQISYLPRNCSLLFSTNFTLPFWSTELLKIAEDLNKLMRNPRISLSDLLQLFLVFLVWKHLDFFSFLKKCLVSISGIFESSFNYVKPWSCFVPRAELTFVIFCRVDVSISCFLHKVRINNDFYNFRWSWIFGF